MGGRKEERSPHLELKSPKAQVLGAPERRRAERQTRNPGFSGPGVRANRATGDWREAGVALEGGGTQSHRVRPAQPAQRLARLWWWEWDE